MTAASFPLVLLQPENPPLPLLASRYQCQGTDTTSLNPHGNRILKESSLAVRHTEGMPAPTLTTPHGAGRNRAREDT